MSFDRPIKLRARGLVLVGALVLSMMALPLKASAHYENFATHKWNIDPGYLPYTSDCVSGLTSFGGNWQTRVDEAATNWSSAGTKVRFAKVSWPIVSGNCSSDPEYLATKALPGGSMVASYLGWTEDYTRLCLAPTICWYDFNWNNHIDASLIWLNVWPGSFDSLSGWEMRSAVVHEFGHTLGVAHSGYYADEFPPFFPPFPALAYSVMDKCCVYEAPTGHDIDDLKALYP